MDSGAGRMAGSAKALAGAAALLIAGVGALLPVSVAAQNAPFCGPGEAPHVASIFQVLVDHYGDAVGDAVECAHPEPPSGDTLQRTTTGLLYLRHGADTAVFTDGQNHYAWTAQGPVGWDGPSPDAPLGLTLQDIPPTWCRWERLAPTLDGYLCATTDGAVTAWARAGSGWILLGSLSGPSDAWSLPDAGRQLLGGPAPPPATTVPPAAQPTPAPARPAPTATPAPSDLDLRVSLDPAPTPGASPLVTVGGQVCNQSTHWTANGVTVEVVFTHGGLPTLDRASVAVPTVAANSCTNFSTSAFVLSEWDGVALGRSTWTWGS